MSTHSTSMTPADPGQLVMRLLGELGHQHQPEHMYEAFDHAIGELIENDRFVVDVIDPVTRELQRVHASGLAVDCPVTRHAQGSDHRSITKAVLQQGKSILHNFSPDAGAPSDESTNDGNRIHQALAAPLIVDGEPFGAITLYSLRQDRFNERSLEIVETFSTLLALAISSSNLLNPARRQAEAERVLTETTDKIATVETASALIEEIHQALHQATGAATVRFDRRHDGTFAYADAGDTSALHLAQWELEARSRQLAARLPDLATSWNVSPGLSKTMLFAARDLHTQESLPVRPVGELQELFKASWAVIAPLRSGRETLGVIAGIWTSNSEEVDIAQRAYSFGSIADVAGPALHKLWLLERLDQRVAEIETLRSLTDSIARTPGYQESLDIICRTSRLVTGTDFVAIAETTSMHMVWKAASGSLGTPLLNQRIPVTNHFVIDAMHQKEELILGDARKDPRAAPEIMPMHNHEKLRSSIITPIYVNARLRGLMVFASRRLRAFSPEEITYLHSLAATASTAIASADARVRGDGSDNDQPNPDL